MLREFTQLEIENLAWDMICRCPAVRERLPVDVELLLELEPQIELCVLPGLVTRYSIECCVLRQNDSDRFMVCVDKSVADSRPLSAYRQTLAQALGMMELHSAMMHNITSPDDLQLMHQSNAWPRIARDVRQFALSLMVPEPLVTEAAEQIYPEVFRQYHNQSPASIERFLRNRLAETFCATPEQLQQRMERWPCEIRARVVRSVQAKSEDLLDIELVRQNQQAVELPTD